MKTGDELIDDLAGAILDATPINWTLAETRAQQTDERLIRQLKVLAALSEFHRRTPPIASTPSAASSSCSERDAHAAAEQWGHLRLLERIGRGAFGEVYRAWDTRLDREVALKLLSADPASDAHAAPSIIHEGRLLARVRHPNVVTIYGAERIGDEIGLWMEFVRGRTLDVSIREGKRFSEAEIARVGIEVCRALAAVHAAGLLHRDIKPQNLMLADDDRPVLMDFGAGRQLADNVASDLAGTPLYLAPEVLRGGEASVQSDIYGLGTLLYYLASGSQPVRARTLSDLRLAHERREPSDIRASRPDLSPDLAAVINRAIDPEPGRRYATAAEMAEALESAGGAAHGHIGATTARRNRRWVVGALTAACLALPVAGGYSQWQVTRLKVAARDVFYAMKALDVDIANLERTIAQSGNPDAKARLQEYTRRRRDVQNAYNSYVERLNLSDARLTKEEELILRITRVFGESELAAPTDYIENVRTYIRKWQASDGYERAIVRAERMGYARPIAEEFVAHHLPPQFFYLALQESKFDPLLSGPPTAYGITKGMWQLMPETAARYGLTIGPLANLRQPDPGDDRHDWLPETRAAARYIKDIYSMDAQASGLLVIAGYNWGEGKIFELLRSMPANPEERNFWKLLERHGDRLSEETYEFVYSIVAAAVIGEDPRLFGYGFDNPLAFLEKQ